MGEVAALFVETGGCYFGLPGVIALESPEERRSSSLDIDDGLTRDLFEERV